MSFENKLKDHINNLERRPDYKSDQALKRIVELLKQIKTESDLSDQSSLLNRIAIDSVENWDTINFLGEFMKANSK